MDLPLVGSIPTCPKCALPSMEGGVRLEYHAEVPSFWLTEHIPCLRLLNETRQETGEDATDVIEQIGEHICRICTRCRYGWVERTADTEECAEDEDAGL